jgi:hypothetical protein
VPFGQAWFAQWHLWRRCYRRARKVVSHFAVLLNDAFKLKLQADDDKT